jgi:hypothetical protein
LRIVLPIAVVGTALQAIFTGIAFIWFIFLLVS